MNPTYDYTLKIEFERCNLKDLQDILKILYNSPDESQKDILEMSDHIIIRIKDIGYDLKLEKYKGFCVFIKDLFNVLKKIRAERHVLELHKTFNHYIQGEPVSPIVDSPESPVKITPPKIMQRVKRSVKRGA
jgi:hypothetical protein